jgi:RecA/RadA recombinase
MAKKDDKKTEKPAAQPLNPDGTPMSKYQIWKMNHPDAAKGKDKKSAEKPAEPHTLSVVDVVPPAPKKIESPKPVVKAPKKVRRESDDEAVENARLTLNEMFDDIKKQFGDEAVFVPALMDVGSYPQVERIPITSPKITDLMGGGIPKARHLELYGEESSGKTSIACYLAGQVQKAGGIVAYVDVEQALDLEYAKSFGLDVDHMLFSQPSSGEKALDLVEAYVRKRVDCVVVDSVAMLVPQAEIDGEMGDAHMALQARMMSKALRKLTSAQAESKTVIIWINQTRVAIGCVSKETTLTWRKVS